MGKFLFPLFLLFSAVSYSQDNLPTTVACGVDSGNGKIAEDLHEEKDFIVNTVSIQKFNKEIEYIVSLNTTFNDLKPITHLTIQIKDLISGQISRIEETFSGKGSLSTLVNRDYEVAIRNSNGGLLGVSEIKEISVGCGFR